MIGALALIATAYFILRTQFGQRVIDTVSTTFNPLAVQKSLDLLQPDFRAKIDGYMGEAADMGFHLVVVETLRSKERQAVVLAAGASHTMNSHHLPHPPDGKGRAVDTLPKGFVDTSEGNDAAVALLQDPRMVALRAKWGLKNLPSIEDYGHLEDA